VVGLRVSISISVIVSFAVLAACERQVDETDVQRVDTPTEMASGVDVQTDVVQVDVSADRTWQRGQSDLQARLNIVHRSQRARNVIVFIADGMSIPTIAAARIFDGQSNDTSGVENVLSFEQFPHVALIKTYNTDSQVADSASTATAIVTGIKTRTGAISVGPTQDMSVCSNPMSAPDTLAEIAETRGMATGIVSTARITHATPATMYAHSLSRGWEADDDLPGFASAAGCEDIASQLISFGAGDGIDLVLGGGLREFIPAAAGGVREDGRDLLAEWRGLGRSGVTVTNATDFRSLNPVNGGQVLGLFTSSHMSFETDRDDTLEPSLAEMTAFAIERLSQSSSGYVLMVEAGRVDHAHHDTNAHRALTDMQAYSEAIAMALEHVDLDETLILVTADHGHVMTFSGYPARDNPILGLVRRIDPSLPGSEPRLTLADDGRPYTTLNYQIGENVRTADSDSLTDAQVLDPDYLQQTAIPDNETHSGDDVALYATGPRAHLFGGSLEQNSIFHLIDYALDWSSDDVDEDVESSE
jgi:alkaline phosphatase